MKNMFESEESFMAYAEIDYCYFLLKELLTRLEKPSSPLQKMVDEATGYAKAQEKIYRKQAISLIGNIIKNKKELGAPVESDEEILSNIKNKSKV